MVRQFHGEVRPNDKGNAVFTPYDVQDFLGHTKKLIGEKVTVTMEKYKPYKKRSLEQNNYWHGVICEILSQENGDTPLYWHKYLKVRFLLGKIIGREPDMEKIIKSGRFEEIAGMLTTTSLSTSEFETLNASVRSWASMKLGVLIPLPNEVPYKY